MKEGRSSFFEKKEPKKLLLHGCVAPPVPHTHGRSFFCFFFLQKKEDSFSLFPSVYEEDRLLRCARNDGWAL
jgi:hypothetical protein